MLIAKNEKGQYCNLLDQAYDTQGLKKSRMFCPVCRGEVVFKNGKVKMPHFAHRSISDCQGFSEGETAEHLAGKKLLYEWGKGACVLEAPLSEISQRPDILFQSKMAIEIQCSPLSIERLKERTAGYFSQGYFQWWLLGGQLIQQGRLTALTKKLCCFDANLGVHFWQVDGASGKVMLNFHVQELWDGSQRWASKVFLPKEWELPEILQYSKRGRYFHHWCGGETFQKDYKRKIAGKLYRRDKKLLTIQGAFYERGGHLLQLPFQCYAFSDYQLLLGDWMLFFRFLIYKEAEKSKKQKMKQVYLQFVQLAEPFLYHFDYPLIDMAELMKGFFIETVRLFAHFKKEAKEDKDSGFATKIPVRNVLR